MLIDYRVDCSMWGLMSRSHLLAEKPMSSSCCLRVVSTIAGTCKTICLYRHHLDPQDLCLMPRRFYLEKVFKGHETSRQAESVSLPRVWGAQYFCVACRHTFRHIMQMTMQQYGLLQNLHESLRIEAKGIYQFWFRIWRATSTIFLPNLLSSLYHFYLSV